MDVYEQVILMADEMIEEMCCQRRDFHKYAENGWVEMRTTSIIARKLADMGYEVLIGESVCEKEARMGVPPKHVLEKEYKRALAQGADPEFVPYTKGGMTGVIGILRCGDGPTVALRFDIDGLGVFEVVCSFYFFSLSYHVHVLFHNCGPNLRDHYIPVLFPFMEYHKHEAALVCDYLV